MSEKDQTPNDKKTTWIWKGVLPLAKKIFLSILFGNEDAARFDYFLQLYQQYLDEYKIAAKNTLNTLKGSNSEAASEISVDDYLEYFQDKQEGREMENNNDNTQIETALPLIQKNLPSIAVTLPLVAEIQRKIKAAKNPASKIPISEDIYRLRSFVVEAAPPTQLRSMSETLIQDYEIILRSDQDRTSNTRLLDEIVGYVKNPSANNEDQFRNNLRNLLQMTNQIRIDIIERSRIRSRLSLWNLGAIFTVLFCLLIISSFRPPCLCSAGFFSYYPIVFLNIVFEHIVIIQVFATGMIGSLLSAQQRIMASSAAGERWIRNIQQNGGKSAWGNILFSPMFVGGIAAMLLFALINAGFVGTMENDENEYYSNTLVKISGDTTLRCYSDSIQILPLRRVPYNSIYQSVPTSGTVTTTTSANFYVQRQTPISGNGGALLPHLVHDPRNWAVDKSTYSFTQVRPKHTRDAALIFILCFIAGFSERLVPDMLDRITRSFSNTK